MSIKITRMFLANKVNICRRLFRPIEEKRMFASIYDNWDNDDDEKQKDAKNIIDEDTTYDPDFYRQETPILAKRCIENFYLNWKPKVPPLSTTPRRCLLKREREKKKKRPLRKCYPGMEREDNCPSALKRKPIKWTEVFPHNVCECRCSIKVKERKENEAKKKDEDILRRRRKPEPEIPCPDPDWEMH